MLLIDASNSMKGVDRLGHAGRAGVRRAQPRAAAVRRLLQRQADRRAAADDRPREGQRGAREGAEARRGHAHLRRARRQRSPRYAARSSAQRGSCFSPTATTSAASRPRLRPGAARRSAHPRVHGRDPVARTSSPDDLERIADDTGGSFALASSPSALTEDLRRARLPARQRVPPPLPLGRAARRERRRRGRRADAEPVSFSYTSPSTGTAAPYKPAFRDELLQSRLLIPLIVALGARARLLHDSGAAEPPHQQGARRAPRRVRHAAARSAQPSAARRSTSCSRPWAAEAAQAQLALDGGLRGGRRRRADQVRPDPDGLGVGGSSASSSAWSRAL